MAPPMMSRMSSSSFHHILRELKTWRCWGVSQSWKRLAKAGNVRIAAQMPKCESVERRNAQLGSRRDAKGRSDTASHFVSGFPGEGQRQNAPAIDSLPDQVHEARRERRGLARTGAGENKLNASSSGCCPLLRRIEVVNLHASVSMFRN